MIFAIVECIQGDYVTYCSIWDTFESEKDPINDCPGKEAQMGTAPANQDLGSPKIKVLVVQHYCINCNIEFLKIVVRYT